MPEALGSSSTGGPRRAAPSRCCWHTPAGRSGRAGTPRAWSVPKGEYESGEDPLANAYREFHEETGFHPPAGTPLPLGELAQPGGKRVIVWALAGDLDPADATSNTFEIEWPRGSGRLRSFPEVDRLAWVGLAQARTMLLKGQVPFLDRLIDALEGGPPSGAVGPPA